MANLRKAARGRDCQVRLPGYCLRDPETVVLCHIRRGGVAGVGQKPADVIGVLGCHGCHEVIDGRRKSEISPEDLDGYILDALCRTLSIWSREGLL